MRVPSVLSICLCIILGNGVAQSDSQQALKPDISITVGETQLINSYDRIVISALREALSRDLTPLSPALYDLRVTYEAAESKTIEGMDTRTLTDVTFMSSLRNNITGEELWTDTRTVTGRGTDRSTSLRSALQKFGKDPAVVSAVTGVVSTDFQTNYVNNCANGLRTLPVEGGKEILLRSLRITEMMQESVCAAQATEKANAITAAIDAMMCKEDLHALRIKVESGVFNPIETVDHLLQISPEAPCAGDAVALAKTIGEQRMDRLRQHQRQAVQNFIEIHVQDDGATRAARYRAWRVRNY